MHHMDIQRDIHSKINVGTSEIFAHNYTWQGHPPYCDLKVSTHAFSQPWSLLHSIMHNPKSTLLSFLHVSKLSWFWGVGFSPHTQIGFEQSEQPFGQFTLHGQSERFVEIEFRERSIYLEYSQSELFRIPLDSLYPSKIMYSQCIPLHINPRIYHRYPDPWKDACKP